MFGGPGGTTFAGSTSTNCIPVQSEVKINGVVTNFEPAVCQVENAGYFDSSGKYIDLGKRYFISTLSSDGRMFILFAFYGGSPRSGTYQIGDNYFVGNYFKGSSNPTGGFNVGIGSWIYGTVTINTENGFHLTGTNLEAYDDINLSIGCCSFK